jgi:hypothetical protein
VLESTPIESETAAENGEKRMNRKTSTVVALLVAVFLVTGATAYAGDAKVYYGRNSCRALGSSSVKPSLKDETRDSYWTCSVVNDRMRAGIAGAWVTVGSFMDPGAPCSLRRASPGGRNWASWGNRYPDRNGVIYFGPLARATSDDIYTLVCRGRPFRYKIVE